MKRMSRVLGMGAHRKCMIETKMKFRRGKKTIYKKGTHFAREHWTNIPYRELLFFFSPSDYVIICTHFWIRIIYKTINIQRTRYFTKYLTQRKREIKHCRRDQIQLNDFQIKSYLIDGGRKKIYKWNKSACLTIMWVIAPESHFYLWNIFFLYILLVRTCKKNQRWFEKWIRNRFIAIRMNNLVPLFLQSANF